jgi:DeoR/GlpR family transcriptional regulator of sugar metabolism
MTDFLGLDDYWLTVALIHMLVGAAAESRCISIEDITQMTSYKAPSTIRRYLAALADKGLARNCRSAQALT